MHSSVSIRVTADMCRRCNGSIWWSKFLDWEEAFYGFYVEAMVTSLLHEADGTPLLFTGATYLSVSRKRKREEIYSSPNAKMPRMTNVYLS